MIQSTDAGVLLTEDALQTMLLAGADSLPRETGGILVGFRTRQQVVVTRACLVEDDASSTHDYRLDVTVAGMALMQLRSGPDDIVGYVGDWHTHPAPTPPSALDESSLRRAAAASGDLLALLVVSFDGAARPSQLYGRLGQPRHPMRRRRARATRPHVVVDATNVKVTDLTAAELELNVRLIKPTRAEGPQ